MAECREHILATQHSSEGISSRSPCDHCVKDHAFWQKGNWLGPLWMMKEVSPAVFLITLMGWKEEEINHVK
jgi:hypothetical protein